LEESFPEIKVSQVIQFNGCFNEQMEKKKGFSGRHSGGCFSTI
jgi:hypothetical protein